MQRVDRAKTKAFDLLISELLGGELTQELADQIVEMVADNPAFERELLAQVRVHNLLCQHFAKERARLGIPETETMPKSIDVSVVRIQGLRRSRDKTLRRDLRDKGGAAVESCGQTPLRL